MSVSLDLAERLAEARQIMESAIAEFKPDAIIPLFSGGHDSLSVTHFAFSHEFLGRYMTTAAHIDTGIGIPDTQKFVIDTCGRYGWPLKIYRAMENTKSDGTPDPQNYEDIVVKNGFPGAFAHRFMYIKLKERQVNRLVREYKQHGKVMLISGCRKQESTRRMGTVEPIKVDGNTVWCAPFTNMSALQVSEYVTVNNIQRNMVKDLLHMSGECLCGAFAHKGELKEIECWYPEVAARIRRIEAKVKAAGFPWGWEDSPPKWWLEKNEADEYGQSEMFASERDEVLTEQGFLPLCTGCGKKFEESV